jgi:hypothetical protein
MRTPFVLLVSERFADRVMPFGLLLYDQDCYIIMRGSVNVEEQHRISVFPTNFTFSQGNDTIR